MNKLKRVEVRPEIILYYTPYITEVLVRHDFVGKKE